MCVYIVHVLNKAVEQWAMNKRNFSLLFVTLVAIDYKRHFSPYVVHALQVETKSHFVEPIFKLEVESDVEGPFINRRDALKSAKVSTASILASTLVWNSSTKSAKAQSSGLAEKLSKRDTSELKNSVFNIPPSAQKYPQFMRGTWNVSIKFNGYVFPSKTISKADITSNVSIPGFQKCSIAQIADVGRERTNYKMIIEAKTGLEDRSHNIRESVDAHLGGVYKAVENVSYDLSNPNRITIDFVRYQTRNAERIELFCNARESELITQQRSDASQREVFVCSEYIRQVTLGLSTEFGVARQAGGNYAHFWTWREPIPESDMKMTGNLLTAVYLDPQDALFFKEPAKPVAVYSHDIIASKTTG